MAKWLKTQMKQLVRVWPWLAIFLVFALTTLQLLRQGRSWWCSCGRPFLWSGDIWSSHNSQHLFDPYLFTHMLHGVVFCGLLAWAVPRLSSIWRLVIATSMEALWEVVENSRAIIERYREATAALGYQGDAIANSLSDIVVCGLGFLFALNLGLRRSLVLFLVTELALLVWIRDGLVLNVILLAHPVDVITTWQMGANPTVHWLVPLVVFWSVLAISCVARRPRRPGVVEESLAPRPKEPDPVCGDDCGPARDTGE